MTVFIPYKTDLMTDKEAAAAAPSGEVGTDPMTDGSHPDLSFRRKDPDVHRSCAVPGQ